MSQLYHRRKKIPRLFCEIFMKSFLPFSNRTSFRHLPAVPPPRRDPAEPVEGWPLMTTTSPSFPGGQGAHPVSQSRHLRGLDGDGRQGAPPGPGRPSLPWRHTGAGTGWGSPGGRCRSRFSLPPSAGWRGLQVMLASSGLERSPRQGPVMTRPPPGPASSGMRCPSVPWTMTYFSPKFLADPDAGGDIVRPVGVDMDRQFPVDHREQGLQLGVIVRLLLVLILGRPLQLLPVLHRLGQILPDHGGGGHTGGGVSWRSW